MVPTFSLSESSVVLLSPCGGHSVYNGKTEIRCGICPGLGTHPRDLRTSFIQKSHPVRVF